MRRLKISVLLLLALLFLLPASSGAEAASFGGGSPENRIKLGSDTFYDTAEDSYIYRMNTAEIRMNVPSGIVTGDPVSVRLPAGMDCKIYRNGQLLSGTDPLHITETGAYVIVFGDKLGSVDFTIIGAVSGNLVRYSLPEGFTLRSLLLDGAEIADSGTYADFSREGSYELRYGCDAIRRYYSLQLTADYTAPTLSFTNLENGHADGPVEIRGAEPGDSVTIVRNGKKIPFTEKLTSGGSYTVTVSDAAGNSNVYQFSISAYYSFNATACIILFAAVIAAAVIYIAAARKRLRIR